MSIEKIKKLIDEAPEFKRWWEQNHTQIQAGFKKKSKWFSRFAAAMFCGGVGLLLYGAVVIGPNPLPWEVFGLVGCVFLYVFLVAHCCVKLNKWYSRWPQNTPKILLEFLNADKFLKEGVIISSSKAEKQKEIVKTMVHHPNVEARHHATQLLSLKNMNMPDMWWRALELSLQEVPQPSKTSEQELESVYVEIEQVAQQGQKIVSNSLKI